MYAALHCIRKSPLLLRPRVKKHSNSNYAMTNVGENPEAPIFVHCNLQLKILSNSGSLRHQELDTEQQRQRDEGSRKNKVVERSYK